MIDKNICKFVYENNLETFDTTKLNSTFVCDSGFTDKNGENHTTYYIAYNLDYYKYMTLNEVFKTDVFSLGDKAALANHRDESAIWLWLNSNLLCLT